MVLPEPTPYRNPMLDALSERPEVELTALYVGGTQQRRTFELELRHRAVQVDGVRIPGAQRLLRHDYPLSFGTIPALRAARPEVVVVSGWSTFGSQAALLWCRVRRVPYLLLVESHDRGNRAGWRRKVKGAIVPSVVRAAEHVLVVGSLARESVLARGADPARVDLFANTIDIAAFADRVDRARRRRDELRGELGVGSDDVAVLCVGRLSPEKGLDTLVDAAAGYPGLVLLLAGNGPERDRLVAQAGREGVRLVALPEIPWERIAERYAAADVFALLSTRETWGVVVNEALAAGLPVVLSDGVGAAHDLLDEGRNGFLVTAGDHVAVAEALRTLASDPALRREMGAASRELVVGWGYEPSIENLVRVVLRVAGRVQG
jgi:glycosyltransferase involved in cell wall biosynthesis